MTDDAAGVFRAYADRVRIVEVSPEHPGDPGPQYRFEAPQHVGRTFDEAHLAELYAAVYFAVDGFREEDTGRRGVPLTIARADDAVLAAYTLAARPGTSPTWLRRTFDIDAEQVQAWLKDVRERAAAHPAVEVFDPE